MRNGIRSMRYLKVGPFCSGMALKIKETEYIRFKSSREFGSYLGGRHCLAVTSGTAAIRVALAAAGITVGHEVITQAFTFVATAEAIIESGAQPVCVDIDATLNMDPVL